jgi:hypothetical protein
MEEKGTAQGMVVPVLAGRPYKSPQSAHQTTSIFLNDFMLLKERMIFRFENRALNPEQLSPTCAGRFVPLNRTAGLPGHARGAGPLAESWAMHLVFGAEQGGSGTHVQLA